MNAQIIYELRKLYHSGDRVTNKILKQQIEKIYDKVGYHATAKGTDIAQYGFITKKCKIPINGKRVDGVELICL